MTGKERIRTAMLGGKADRVPFMPQICFPHAVIQLEKDYVEGIIKCVEDAHFRMETMFEITKMYHSDGFRILGADDVPVKVFREGEKYIVCSKETGERLGTLNLDTGGITQDEYPIKIIEDIEKISVPSVDELLSRKEFSLYGQACKWAGEDYNKIGGISLGLSSLVSSRGMDSALYDLYDNQYMVEAVLDKYLNIAINRAKAFQKSGIDTIYVGDPWSSCSVISPQSFEKYTFPCFKQFVDEIKSTGMTIYVHICGNVEPVIERIVDMGSHCMEPMDPLGGVSAQEFRKRVGSRISLMGGVNTVTLSSGTPDDVKKEALECIEGAGKDGGYILAAGDMVPFETPRENVMAMRDVAQNYEY